MFDSTLFRSASIVAVLYGGSGLPAAPSKCQFTSWLGVVSQTGWLSRVQVAVALPALVLLPLWARSPPWFVFAALALYRYLSRFAFRVHCSTSGERGMDANE